jgi:hypothetical protein
MPVEFSPKAPIENSPLYCGSVATEGLRRDDSGETFEIEVDDGPKGASRDERAGRRCLGWPTAAAWRGFGDGGLPRVTGLRQQVGVLTQSVAGALDLHDDGVVQQPVEQGGGDDRIAEAVEMPRRLTGESLKSGWLTRIIPSMATPILSATDALDGDRR